MNKRKLTVIIPSRTQPQQSLFLKSAIAAIREQTAINNFTISILIGIDKGKELHLDPEILFPFSVNIIESEEKSQAAALNAAIRCVNTEFVAFLEDDDIWFPDYLQTVESVISAGIEFVSSTQLEVDENSCLLRINDFPTPSGWFMPSKTLQMVGEFDEAYKFHLDNDWLGRLGASRASRAHLVEFTAPIDLKYVAQIRPWLSNVITLGGEMSQLCRHNSPYPLVKRLVHSGSGMAQISTNASYAEISKQECAKLISTYGRIPW